jgi:hypothetical protein
MQETIQLTIVAKNENDVQALISLYAGLLGIRSNNQLESKVLDEMCSQLGASLEKLYTPEDWKAVQQELGVYSQKAAHFANNSENAFDSFTL